MMKTDRKTLPIFWKTFSPSTKFARGEVITFHHPYDPHQLYRKRIIGLPGEKIKIHRGVITINGTTLKEPFREGWTFEECEVTLHNDEYYVLGDNRLASIDSRMFGPIKAVSIIKDRI